MKRLAMVVTLWLASASLAAAQIADAPGSSPARDGGGGNSREAGRPGRLTATPTPDTTAHDTIEMMQRARARASGTPIPEPTQPH